MNTGSEVNVPVRVLTKICMAACKKTKTRAKVSEQTKWKQRILFPPKGNSNTKPSAQAPANTPDDSPTRETHSIIGKTPQRQPNLHFMIINSTTHENKNPRPVLRAPADKDEHRTCTHARKRQHNRTGQNKHRNKNRNLRAFSSWLEATRRQVKIYRPMTCSTAF